MAINLDSVLKDATVWKDPIIFRPERHLDNDGNINRSSASFIPFGTGMCTLAYILSDIFISNQPFELGKRTCPGEPLARTSFYLFVASLAKRFHFKAIDGQPPPTLEPIVGSTLSYQGFQASITIRS